MLSAKKAMDAPDAIVVLAGGIKENPSGRWVSTDLTAEDDILGAPGGKLRVLAAVVLALHKYQNAVVIACGGKGYDVPKGTPEARPICAEILRDELVESDVPIARILLEKNSNTAYQQLQELDKLVAERQWRSIIIIVNRYSLSRVRATLETKFPKLIGSTELLSAEDVLLDADRTKWEALFTEAYASAWLTKRIEKEKQGELQIRVGTYRFQ